LIDSERLWRGSCVKWILRRFNKYSVFWISSCNMIVKQKSYCTELKFIIFICTYIFAKLYCYCLSPFDGLLHRVKSFTGDGVSLYLREPQWVEVHHGSDSWISYFWTSFQMIIRHLSWRPYRNSWDMENIGTTTDFTYTSSLERTRTRVPTIRREVITLTSIGLRPCCFTFGYLLGTELL